MNTEPQVLSVTQLTREIRALLEEQIGEVWVEGEISNHRAQSSGHQYFTLKDEGAQLSCVMFRGVAARSSLRLEDGAQIQACGEISVYEPRGQYQMIVKRVQPMGVGALQARFEALKRRLHEEGLFDPERKRPVPRYPRVVALVTSPTGAAVRDMLNILTRRAPWIRVLVYPVRVQGQGAWEEMVAALRVLNAAEKYGLPRPDTLVIGRGGGSLEDLWNFNEEGLARAIRDSAIPVISAVGHEIDFTIADFAADLRAPTPSAAAELLAPDAEELRRQFAALARSMRLRVGSVIDHHQQVIELTARGALLREPGRQLLEAEQALDEIETAIMAAADLGLRDRREALAARREALAQFHPRRLLDEAAHRIDLSSHRLRQGAGHRLQRLADLLEARGQALAHLGPDAILARGFSYTTDAKGRVIKDAATVKKGDRLTTVLAKGKIASKVE